MENIMILFLKWVVEYFLQLLIKKHLQKFF